MTEPELIAKFLSYSPEKRLLLLQLADIKTKRVSEKYPLPDELKADAVIILGATCKALQLDLSAMKFIKRTRQHTDARKIASYLLVANRYRGTDIAQIFECNHSTITYNCDMHTELIKTDVVYQDKFNRVVEHLKTVNHA